MKRIIRKISNNRGSGILYALLALLVIATVSAVIITAAMANTGRVENRVEEEQLYLAAESVAEILSNDWDYNLGCAYFYKDTEWELYWEVEGDKPESERTAPFSAYFHNLAKSILDGTEPERKEFSLEINDDAGNFDNISLSATLSAPSYEAAPKKIMDIEEAKAQFNKYADIDCEIKASYIGKDDISPYIIVIKLVPVTSFPYDRTLTTNWEVSSIKQGVKAD